MQNSKQPLAKTYTAWARCNTALVLCKPCQMPAVAGTCTQQSLQFRSKRIVSSGIQHLTSLQTLRLPLQGLLVKPCTCGRQAACNQQCSTSQLDIQASSSSRSSGTSRLGGGRSLDKPRHSLVRSACRRHQVVTAAAAAEASFSSQNQPPEGGEPFKLGPEDRSAPQTPASMWLPFKPHNASKV